MAHGPLDLPGHFPASEAVETPPDLPLWETEEGFAVRALYGSDFVSAAPPPVRGPLHIREDVRASSAEDANRLAMHALGNGATSVGFVLESAPSEAEVRRMIRDIDAATTPLHWEVARGHLRTLVACLGVAGGAGSVSFDAAARPDDAPYDELAALCRSATGSGMLTIRVDTRPYHMAGATRVWELACALAAASDAFAHLTDRGIEAREIARRMHFVVPVGTGYFMGIAKMRALRGLAPQVGRAYGAGRALPVIDAVTSVRSHARLDVEMNLVRAATQAMAAVVGGCSSLRVEPHDAGPNAARLARNVQLILRHEACLDAVSDPAAGAPYVEALTDALAREAWSRFQLLEAEGGLVRVSRRKSLERTFHDAHRKRRLDLATGKRLMVGVNALPDVDGRVQTARTYEAGRDAEAFETLRLESERFRRKRGRLPSAVILPPGADPRTAAFARRILGSAGFAVVEGSGPAAAPDVVAVCGQAERSDLAGYDASLTVAVGSRLEDADHVLLPGDDTVGALKRILDDLDI